MMMKLPPIETDPGFWFDLAIDRELDRDQRAQLLAYLEQCPDANRILAKRLLTEQSIAESIQSAVAGSSQRIVQLPMRKEPTVRSPKSMSGYVLVATLIGLMLGWMGSGLTRGASDSSANLTDAEMESMISDISQRYRNDYELMYQVKVAKIESENRIAMDRLRKTLNHNPTLIEVENSANRAVYYTRHRIPDFLLDAMVLAGHRATLKRQTFKYENNGSEIEYPIHSLEIDKYALLTTAQNPKEKQ